MVVISEVRIAEFSATLVEINGVISEVRIVELSVILVLIIIGEAKLKY
jgi:hypothetical protein